MDHASYVDAAGRQVGLGRSAVLAAPFLALALLPLAAFPSDAVMRGFVPGCEGDVRAKTVNTSANPPFVVQIFVPWSTNPPAPSGSARVWIAAASLPAPGSVSAKAARRSILSRIFCSATHSAEPHIMIDRLANVPTPRFARPAPTKCSCGRWPRSSTTCVQRSLGR